MNFSTNVHRVENLEISEIRELDCNGRISYVRDITIETDSGSYEITVFADDEGKIKVDL